MQSKLLATVGVLAIPPAVCLILSACGGSGNGAANSGGGAATGHAYITAAAPENAQTPGTLYQYRVGQDGSLTALSVATVPVGPNPRSVVSDPSGHSVYVVNADNTISQYTVGAGGGLAPLSPAVVDIGGPPSLLPTASSSDYSATVDASGRFLYVVVQPALTLPLREAYIAEYAIAAGGQLTALTPAYVVAPINVSGGGLAIDSGGKHAYLGGRAPGLLGPGGEIAEFSIAEDGTLAPLVPATVVTPTEGSIALSATSAYLLSACADTSCNGQATQYAIQSDGSLTSTGTTTVVGSHVVPITLLTNTSGSAAFLLTNLMGVDTNEGAVYQYTINSTGGLVPNSPPSLGVASGAVAEGILGPDLHVLSSNAVGLASGAPPGGHVDHYTIGADGQLTYTSTTSVATGDFPTAMTLVIAH